VLAGTGTAGAYQAGVLRALGEAGIKIDVMAGRGIGVGTALAAGREAPARRWGSGGHRGGSRAAIFGAAGLEALARGRNAILAFMDKR
jgi:hypothetical protein